MAVDCRRWTPVAEVYDPVLAGSIDGTDAEPHDHGIVRALNSTYRPNKGVIGDPDCTVFIGRLNHVTNDDTVRSVFSKYGQVKRLRLVRDLVTGFSKGYAFVEYYDRYAAYKATRDANKMVVDDKEILVDMECERTLAGWIPRRLGGGLGGRKESGQLRFGGNDRPFRKPIVFGKGTGDWSQSYGGERSIDSSEKRDNQIRERADQRSLSRVDTRSQPGSQRDRDRSQSRGQREDRRDYRSSRNNGNDRDRSRSRDRRR